jgi:rRNA maturation endonuclease Nob1
MSDEKQGQMMVRCKNCIQRFEVKPKVERAKCPTCGAEYRISWPKPDLPYIRGNA